MNKTKQSLAIIGIMVFAVLSVFHFEKNTFGAPLTFVSTPATTTALTNFAFTVGTTTPQGQYGTSTLAVYGSTTVQTWLNTVHALEVFNAASTSVFQVSTAGAGSTSVTVLSITSTTATSTGAYGFNLTGGCFAINGTCLPSSGVTGTGVLNTLAYWTGTDSLGATSTGITAENYYATSTSLFSRFAGGIISAASSTFSSGAFRIDGAATLAGGLTLTCSSCITDANVSDTLTASDLVSGSSVVANAEVDDDITLTNITQITNRAISDTTGTLTVARGGTNATAFSPTALVYSDGTSLLSTSSPVVGFITATTSTYSVLTGGLISQASSTFSDGLNVSNTFRLPTNASSTITTAGELEGDTTDIALHWQATTSMTYSQPFIKEFGFTLGSSTASEDVGLGITLSTAFKVTRILAKSSMLDSNATATTTGYVFNLQTGTSKGTRTSIFTANQGTSRPASGTSTFTALTSGFNKQNIPANDEWWVITSAASSSLHDLVVKIEGYFAP